MSEINGSMVARLHDLQNFYQLMDGLSEKVGGSRLLSECTGRNTWPRRGVYFFTEGGERRIDGVEGCRIVRVGTHALKAGAGTILWNRLSQHRGVARSGGGNHRGSIFRLIVGTALMKKHDLMVPTWGQGSSAPKEIRSREQELERLVSQTIGAMRVLWLSIPDEAGPDSLRGYIERNAIALLSNYSRAALDPPSSNWLGYYCDRERVRGSGLWNQNHVDENYAPAFLETLERLVMEVDTII